MIKTFKDFDSELKGQKIYEAIDDVRDEKESKYTFTENDVFVPELISDNKFLMKITKIILKRLDASNLGSFGVHPMIITINDVPGVYFYNYDNPEINIVICRNTNGKHVYLFKEFTLDAENTADLVLSTTKLGFSDIIDAMISKLTPNAVDEGLILEWTEGGTYDYDEILVSKAASLPLDVRQTIIDIFCKPKKMPSYNDAFNQIWDGYEEGDEVFVRVCDEIQKVCGGGKKLTKTGYIKKVINIFNYAVRDMSSHEEVSSVLNDCSFGSAETSAITSARGVSAKVEDGETDARREAYEKMLAEDAEIYESDMNEIYDIASAMCNYVKKNGFINDEERSALPRRGMIITGKAGVGKSKSIEDALRDNKMIENKDYYNMSNGSTAIKSLYKKFYDYNGKLLIFDDSADLFNTPYKMSFWKQALAAKVEDANVAIPIDVSTSKSKSSDSNVYNADGKTRQERYFLEVGHSSNEEEKKFRKNRYEELRDKFREEEGTYTIPKDKEIEWKEMIDDEWAKHEENKVPLMPDKFRYKGVVIIISNESRDALKKSLGDEHWKAIARRTSSFDLNPMAESIWRVIKKKILAQTADETLDDRMRMIPIDMVDEFIEEVEANLADPKYRDINFGVVADTMHNTLNGAAGRAVWKRRLKREMSIQK